MHPSVHSVVPCKFLNIAGVTQQFFKISVVLIILDELIDGFIGWKEKGIIITIRIIGIQCVQHFSLQKEPVEF